MSYKFRPGTRTSGIDPQIVGEELERIVEKHGYLQPAIVVIESENPKAPLHPMFEWDNAKAGQQYREWQARCLIKSITVITEDRSPEPVYIHVRTDSNVGKYLPTDVVVADVDLFDTALQELYGKLLGARKAVNQLNLAAERSGSSTNIQKAAMIKNIFESCVDSMPFQ